MTVARHRRLATWALLTATAASACGGSKAAVRDEGSPSAGDDRRAAAASSPKADAAADSGGSGPARDATKRPGPEPSKPVSDRTGGANAATAGTTSDERPLPMEAALGETCVRAGGRQTLKVTTLERAAVGYDSYYSDGTSGVSDGFYGGNNGAVVGPSGVYEDAWTIAPNAPPGVVRVMVQGVAMGHSAAERTLTFQLVSPTAACP